MMGLGKLKEFIMKDNVFTVSMLIAIVTFIGSVTFYKYNELKSVERNVESSIVKGIDPVAVRCAYASERDLVCVTYAATHTNQNINPAPKR
jgi:hypothetical protein